MADRHAKCCRILRHLANERRPSTGGGLDRASQGVAVTHQQIEIHSTTWDLGDRSVADRSTQSRHVHLAEEVVESRIGGQSPEVDSKRLGERAVVSNGKTLQIPQALATAQDPQHRHQQQIPGRNADPASHPRIRDRPEKADQVEIGCGRGAVGRNQEAIPPTSTHADRSGKSACDTL